MTSNGPVQGSFLGDFQEKEQLPPWPDGVLYHGSRLLVMVGLAASITALFPPVGRSTVGLYEEGMVLTQPVIAQVPFTVPKSVAELQRERANAAAGVPPTFAYRAEAGDTMVVRLDRFFDQLGSIASVDDSVGDVEGLQGFLLGASVVASPEQATLLLDEDTRQVLRSTAIAGASRLAVIGIADADDARELTTATFFRQDPGATSRRSVPSADVLMGSDFHAQVVGQLRTPSPELSELLRLIIIRHTVYSLVYEPNLTEADREQARQAVPEFSGNVVQREAIVRANEPITAEDLVRLGAYESELRRLQLLEEPGLQIGLLLGSFLLNLAILAVFGALIYFVRPGIYESLRWLLLQAALVAVYFVAARLVDANDLPAVALPVAFVALPVAVLWDSRFALIMGLVVAALTVAQPPFAELDVLFPGHDRRGGGGHECPSGSSKGPNLGIHRHHHRCLRGDAHGAHALGRADCRLVRDVPRLGRVECGALGDHRDGVCARVRMVHLDHDGPDASRVGRSEPEPPPAALSRSARYLCTHDQRGEFGRDGLERHRLPRTALPGWACTTTTWGRFSNRITSWRINQREGIRTISSSPIHRRPSSRSMLSRGFGSPKRKSCRISCRGSSPSITALSSSPTSTAVPKRSSVRALWTRRITAILVPSRSPRRLRSR